MHIHELKARSLRVREHILHLSTDGGCFTGASLSCTDLIVYLYNRVLNVGPHNFDAPDRDYLFLSKGHDVPALYGTFVELGWLAADRLGNHLKTNDNIYWHPNRAIPGIEFHSVHSRSDGQRRRLTEADYQLVDFRLPHCHRQLTRRRVGHS